VASYTITCVAAIATSCSPPAAVSPIDFEMGTWRFDLCHFPAYAGTVKTPGSTLEKWSVASSLGGPAREATTNASERPGFAENPNPVVRWPLASSLGVGCRRGTVVVSHELRFIESYGVVSARLGPGGRLAGACLQHRPAGHCITHRLDKGLHN
jgi:hypothetical protein